MDIYQGDIFWLEVEDPLTPQLADRRPYVVVQNNVINFSRINTVIVVALTTEIKRAGAPGNILLSEGEGNLPRQSVVNVSQVYTIRKAQLGERIGSLSASRVREIVDGICLRLEPRTPHHLEKDM